MIKRESTQHQTVGVVLLNWNGANLTIACLDSLLRGQRVPEQIVVVDNASTDGSAEQISSRFNQVKLIRSAENLGFTGGNNIGINHLLKAGLDYIWVLNNDTEVDKNCLGELVQFMTAEPDICGCCGKILYDQPRDKIWYAGATLNVFLLTAHHRGSLETDHGQYDHTEPTHFITGCSMFVRRTAWESVGLFDESFFAYAEDFDWSLRARNAGLTLAYLPSAVIYHKVSTSFRKTEHRNDGYTTPLMIKLAYRNKLYIIKKHSKLLIQKYVCIAMFVSRTIYYSIGLLVLRRFSKLRALWSGVNEGFK